MRGVFFGMVLVRECSVQEIAGHRFGYSAGILPANAAKMAALRCPANYWTLS